MTQALPNSSPKSAAISCGKAGKTWCWWALTVHLLYKLSLRHSFLTPSSHRERPTHKTPSLPFDFRCLTNLFFLPASCLFILFCEWHCCTFYPCPPWLWLIFLHYLRSEMKSGFTPYPQDPGQHQAQTRFSLILLSGWWEGVALGRGRVGAWFC